MCPRTSVLVFVLTLFHLSSSCQEPWVLRTETNMFGRTISFKNVTIVGMQESYSWVWSESNGMIWENKILYGIENGNMEGVLALRDSTPDQQMQVRVTWELPKNKDLVFRTINKKIFNTTWGISVCNVIDVNFEANEKGHWVFKIGPGEKNVVSYVRETLHHTHMVSKNSYRRKRSEFEELPRIEPTIPEGTEPSNTTIQKAGVFDCIYEFFFGEGDPATGRSTGVFTRVKNWMKGVACRIRGNCESGPSSNPSYIPQVTMPPFNPDAEPAEIPGSPENDENIV